MDRDGARGDDVYQPDGSEVQDDEGLLEPEDTLIRGADPYDEGYSPPERPSPAVRYGVTAAERQRGESLDELLAEEEPDITVPEGDGVGDTSDTDGEPLDAEVGAARAGRLVSPDEGTHEDAEATLVASDIGVDGAAASAEEAAVHIVDEDTYEPAPDPGTGET
ncbi:DUF5709 domain-containing protein [Streptomyces sp. HNM0574]|uniref:DUF5709 domain-containing protein n=1 Tax=Streptomyces sp. HNM0574 TaxID=2714954 RepID=UPI00146C4725|nr:hypothetical protein [Streptomyces sp. HNM0574]